MRGSMSPAKHAVKSSIMPLASRRLGRETAGTFVNQQLGPRSCVNPGVNPEDDPNPISSDLDALDQRTNDVALRRPVRVGEPVMHHRGEQVQLADYALKGADLLLSGLLGIDLSLKPCRASAQVRDARFELWLLNQPLGIAVDQATDRTARFGELAGERIKL